MTQGFEVFAPQRKGYSTDVKTIIGALFGVLGLVIVVIVGKTLIGQKKQINSSSNDGLSLTTIENYNAS